MLIQNTEMWKVNGMFLVLDLNNTNIKKKKKKGGGGGGWRVEDQMFSKSQKKPILLAVGKRKTE